LGRKRNVCLSRFKVSTNASNEFIAQHDAAAGMVLADRAWYGFAGEIACAQVSNREAFCRRVKAAVPSAKPCRMAYPPGMRDSHVRTDLRAGDIAGWGWERLCAVANSLGQDVVVTLRPRTVCPPPGTTSGRIDPTSCRIVRTGQPTIA
jgi:hypothetical protein